MSPKTVAGRIRSSRLILLFAVLPLTPARPVLAQAPVDRAWTVLQSGLADKSTVERAAAVRMLGLLENDPQAPELALKALGDDSPEVRAAAADALGQMKAEVADSRLAGILISDEKEVSVILACARSMISLGDDRACAVYFAVLTGERKSGGGCTTQP